MLGVGTLVSPNLPTIAADRDQADRDKKDMNKNQGLNPGGDIQPRSQRKIIDKRAAGAHRAVVRN